MPAGHDDVVIVLAGKLRDHVHLRPRLRRRHLDKGGRTGLCQRRAVCEGCSHDRDGHGGAVGQERPDDQPFTVGCVALIEDDYRLGTGSLRIDRLYAEGASATLDQRDVGRAAPADPGEIACLAAARACPRRHEIDVDRNDLPLHRAASAAREGPRRIGGRHRRQLLKRRRRDESERELVELHAPACRLERVDNVVDARRVPAGSRLAGSAVGVSDRLQGGLMFPHLGDADALKHLLIRVVHPLVAVALRNLCQRRVGGHQARQCDGRDHKASGASGPKRPRESQH